MRNIIRGLRIWVRDWQAICVVLGLCVIAGLIGWGSAYIGLWFLFSMWALFVLILMWMTGKHVE